MIYINFLYKNHLNIYWPAGIVSGLNEHLIKLSFSVWLIHTGKAFHSTFKSHIILPIGVCFVYKCVKSCCTAFRNHVILPSEIMSHSFRNQVFLLLKINHVASTLENILPFKVMSYTQSVCVPLSRNYTLSNSLI